MKKEIFIKGMHCASCEVTVSETFLEHSKLIEFATVDIKNGKITIEGNFDEIFLKKEIPKIAQKLQEFGYEILQEKEKRKLNFEELFFAFLIATLSGIAFLFFQKFGFLNSFSANIQNFFGIFLVGIIASLSTCMAVVGGITLSYFSNETRKKNESNFFSGIIFHISRIFFFFILGGLIGVFGKIFAISEIFLNFFGIFVAIAMFILGLNLLEITHFSISMPKFFARKFKNKNFGKFLTPIFLGFLTFFMPCGFTQTMQVFAISKADFFQSGLVMFFFALGTLPVLSILTFSSQSVVKFEQKNFFFKIIGFLIIFLSIVNLYSSIVKLGIIQPFINF
ncbi:MAG: hypothetical protein Fur0024_1680 [Patescibacteria group bacterium]